MRTACSRAAELLEQLDEHVVEGNQTTIQIAFAACAHAKDWYFLHAQTKRAGATTAELDELAYKYIVDIQKAIPAPLGYGGLFGWMKLPPGMAPSPLSVPK